MVIYHHILLLSHDFFSDVIVTQPLVRKRTFRWQLCTRPITCFMPLPSEATWQDLRDGIWKNISKIHAPRPWSNEIKNLLPNWAQSGVFSALVRGKPSRSTWGQLRLCWGDCPQDSKSVNVESLALCLPPGGKLGHKWVGDVNLLFNSQGDNTQTWVSLETEPHGLLGSGHCHLRRGTSLLLSLLRQSQNHSPDSWCHLSALRQEVRAVQTKGYYSKITHFL